MKKPIISFLCVVFLMLALTAASASVDSGIAVNAGTFPDEYFRAYVSMRFDADGDGVLSEEEISRADTIDLSNFDNCKNNTTTLQGIEFFPQLQVLNAPGLKKLTGTIDLRRNTMLADVNLRCNGRENFPSALLLGSQENLQRLILTNTAMTALDVMAARGLRWLEVDGNPLAALDLSGNPQLQVLYASYQLTALDLSHNPALVSLRLHHVPNLTELPLNGLANLRQLSVQYTPIAVLDISECPVLVELANSGDYQDLGDRILYETNNTDNADRLFYSKTTVLKTSSAVPVTEAFFPDSLFRAYVSMRFDADGDGVLSEEEISRADTIDLSNFDNCKNNTTTLQGIEFFPQLQVLNAPGLKKLTGTIDLRRNTMLADVNLRCNGRENFPSALLLGSQENLQRLILTNTAMTALDVSGCPQLRWLEVDGNPLAALDLSGNPQLQVLYASYSQLTALDLSHNPALVSLRLHHVPNLTELPLNGLANLRQLSVQYTPIAVLDISECPVLVELANSGDYQDLGDRILYETNNTDNADRLFYSKTTLLKTARDQVFTILTLPASLNRIEAEASAGIMANIVIVPQGCTEIGSRAFADNTNLLLIYVPAQTTIASDAFSGSPNVYVSRTEN